MDYYFTQEEVDFISNYANGIQRIIGRAIGREEAVRLRREQIREDNDFCAALNEKRERQRKEVIDRAEAEAEKEKVEFWKKHKKEISKMKKLLQEKIEKAISLKPRFHNRVHEKRAKINGVIIYGSSPKLSECERRFMEDLVNKLPTLQELNEADESASPIQKPKATITFREWSAIWLTEIFKQSVSPYTYEREEKTFQRHVAPYFKDRKLRDITPLDCIQFFNRLKEKGIERTAETCYGLTSRIFSFAVESGLIAKSPMANMKPIKHERENGSPLSKSEEKTFLANLVGSDYEALFLLALYTGLRPCELPTARIEGDFIVAQNRKQKSPKKIVFKKIPVTPMLEPYRAKLEADLPKLTATFSQAKYTNTFKKAMPTHRPYDLRDTFATRCQECGVIEQAVQTFMGHVSRTLLGKVYTKFSDEFLYAEGQKVLY